MRLAVVIAFEVELILSPSPVVNELAARVPAAPVVVGAVTDKVPLDTVKFPLVSTVNPATVEAALLSKPEVMVTAPEIVGVAVQAVPVTVRFPPREVKLLPETVKVLLTVVAPESVFAPANVCVPVVTTPPNEALAGSRFNTCVTLMVIPLALGAAPMAARVTGL